MKRIVNVFLAILMREIFANALDQPISTLLSQEEKRK